MSIARNEQALVALVEEAAERRRTELLDAARNDSRALVRSAHAEARAAMRRAFEEERRLERQRVGAAEANLETRRRLAMQRRNAALVAAAWRLLPDALARRWQDASARGPWIDHIVRSACAALPRTGTAWRVVHPATWPAAERETVAATIAAHTGIAPAFVSETSVDAGLRIAADGTSVDGTLEALLADRSDIAAQLLHQFALVGTADAAEAAAR